MNDLFVTYKGTKNGAQSEGWAILSDVPALSNSKAIINLIDNLEIIRQYDKGSIILTGFRRLEEEDAEI